MVQPIGKYRSNRRMEYPEFQTGIFDRMESAQKLKKHQEIVTLAIAKRDRVDRLLSKTLADNQVSDAEFQIIMTEFLQYNVLKEAVRAKLTWQPSRPDVVKIRKDVRGGRRVSKINI